LILSAGTDFRRKANPCDVLDSIEIVWSRSSMDPNVPPKTTAIRKRRWRIGAGLMIVATVSLLLWMLWPAALNNVEKQLVGTWTRRDSPGSVFITFHSNRTVAFQNSKLKPGSGWWWADSGSIYWDEGFKDVMNMRVRKILHGGLDHNKYTLLSVDDEGFRIFVPVNGSTHDWIRVPNASVAASQD